MLQGLEERDEQLAGRYVIERQLGRGGMATVYLTRDLRHPRSVAIKVLRSELRALAPSFSSKALSRSWVRIAAKPRPFTAQGPPFADSR